MADRASSIALRLLAGGALWIAIALSVGGLGLWALFQDHVERSFDTRLQVMLDALIVAAEIDEAGELGVTPLNGEPRFEIPYSGWYWRISDGDSLDEHSRSLWDWPLDLAPSGALSGPREIEGPDGQTLRILETEIRFPEQSTPLRFAVAADLASLTAETRPFAVMLTIALVILGLGLLGALALQVRYGLSPLSNVRSALADVRAGRAERLDGDYPIEVRPLAAELNALIEHNNALLERARRHAGNLAHALKTPLTILGNATPDSDETLSETVREQTENMRRDIERHLAHARAGGARQIGARSDIGPVLEGLRRTLDMLHAERDVDLGIAIEGAPTFRGDSQDLEEMLGNLMDNGCKWAASRVTIKVGEKGGRVTITIDDDGPGLAEAKIGDAMVRGRRLDEATPGDGLGLDIVHDLAELHGGKLALATSPLGGLRATLDLPSVS
jgi:signal transduction histidine kinase